MSHKATNWAFEVRGLTPAERCVLLCLADCHNPVHGCFPQQAYIADACEISRSSVNTHLKALEAKGLIRREQVVDDETKRQRNTRYYLAFEDVDKSTSHVQNLDTEPCPKTGKSRVQNLDTNNPVKNNRKARAREGGAGRVVDNPPAPPQWSGDPMVRARVASDARYGEGFAVSYIDTATPCEGGIVAGTHWAVPKLRGCEVLGLMVFPPT